MNYSLSKYLAGYLDGDGSISLVCRKHKDVYYMSVDVRLTGDQTAAPIFGLLVDTYGGKIVPLRDKLIQYYCDEKTSLRIIEQTYKHMVLKKHHCEFIMDFYKDKLNRDTIQYSKSEKKQIMSKLKVLRNCSTAEKPAASLPWMAGYIDSDGCFYKNTLQFNSHWRCYPALRLVQKYFKGSIQQDKNGNFHLTSYLTNKAHKLQPLIKHLVVKKHKAEILLNNLSTRND